MTMAFPILTMGASPVIAALVSIRPSCSIPSLVPDALDHRAVKVVQVSISLSQFASEAIKKSYLDWKIRHLVPAPWPMITIIATKTKELPLESPLPLPPSQDDISTVTSCPQT